MKIFFLLLSCLASGALGQQLISLSTLTGGGLPYYLKNTDACSIYVSAAFDDDAVLANVIVVSGEQKISLRDLKNRRFPKDTGNLQPYQLLPNSYITSTLATIQLANLKGVLYYNTAKQFQNTYFYVIDVNGPQNINLKGLGAVDITIVFLNTNTNMIPNWSSRFSNWTQDNDASVAIYQGVPGDGLMVKNTQIFSNPMYIDNMYQYFPNVETFSLSCVAFYIKTYKGCSFKLEPAKAILAGTTTSAYSTTGFYMKQQGEQVAATQVNMMRKIGYPGTTGVNVIGHIPDGTSVDFDVYQGSDHWGKSFFPGDFLTQWSTLHVGDDIVISSTNAQMGVYYMQYFVNQDLIPNNVTVATAGTQATTTVKPGNPTVKPTVPGHVETTTKLSGAVFSSFSVFLILMKSL